MIKGIFNSPGYVDINASYERIVNNNHDYDYNKESLKVKVYGLDTLDILQNSPQQVEIKLVENEKDM